MASGRETTGLILLIGGIAALFASGNFIEIETFDECMERLAPVGTSADDEYGCEWDEKNDTINLNLLRNLSVFSVGLGLGLYISSKN